MYCTRAFELGECVRQWTTPEVYQALRRYQPIAVSLHLLKFLQERSLSWAWKYTTIHPTFLNTRTVIFMVSSWQPPYEMLTQDICGTRCRRTLSAGNEASGRNLRSTERVAGVSQQDEQ